MALDVSIRKPPTPSEDGQVQDVVATIEVGENDPNGNVSVDFLLDSTQNGTFIQRDSTNRTVEAGQTFSVRFEQFIEATPPYDLRIRAVLTADSGGTLQGEDTVTVTFPDTDSSPTTTQSPQSPQSTEEQDDLVPKIRQSFQTNQTPGGVREFEPLVVTRLGGTLPWDTDSTQLQCGETVTDSNGDMNIRIVYHCVCTHTQFKMLNRMRDAPESVELISRAYTGPVTFDELKFDRIPDANGAIVRGVGETNQPLYEIQLQSKEDDEDNTLFGEDD